MIEKEISTQEEPENVQRGKSAIVWLKIFIIFAFIIGLFSEYIIVIFKPYMNLTSADAAPPMEFSSAIAFLSYTFLLLIFGIVMFISIFKFCKWMFISIKTLRKFTTTEFSPIAAVICTLIPWVCGIFDYFIFKDILARQENVLKSHNATFVAPKPRILKWILILSIILLAPSIFSEFFVCRLINLLLLFPICGLYIKSMNVMIENEKTLSTIQEQENS
ncbi:hypothetical protein B7990_00395 [Fibrobacter sp. UWB4]|uniref:hypothetical protein n=1 Tax=Fibrobacter sp. UWB4 TaxID=1964356 RepID=UPI000B522E46|nr:hypothetical protein [Fibrobacter sp. UWB4]OWV19671.1 hypothetical protein B7990_00395 [Fibrobacter sp. UWB4]